MSSNNNMLFFVDLKALRFGDSFATHHNWFTILLVYRWLIFTIFHFSIFPFSLPPNFLANSSSLKFHNPL